MIAIDALGALGRTLLVVVDLPARLAALLGPGEVGDGDEEEGVAAVGDTGEGVVPEHRVSGTVLKVRVSSESTYHARKAAKMPKAPPARRSGTLGSPAWTWAEVGVRYAIPRNRKARSSVKNRRKKATVDRRVHIRRIKVKMNQP